MSHNKHTFTYKINCSWHLDYGPNLFIKKKLF